MGFDTSFRKEGLVAYRIAARVILPTCKLPSICISTTASVSPNRPEYAWVNADIRSQDMGSTGVPAHVLQDTHGIVNPFEKRFQLLVILPVQMFLIGQGGGYIRLSRLSVPQVQNAGYRYGRCTGALQSGVHRHGPGKEPVPLPRW